MRLLILLALLLTLTPLPAFAADPIVSQASVTDSAENSGPLVRLVLVTEFWAAVAGALVGGAIALGIQLLVFRASKHQRTEEAEERRTTLGKGLLVKMMRVYSTLFHLHRHLEEPFEKEHNLRGRAEPWQIVTPVANLPSTVHFSTDELVMLMSLGNDDLANNILPFDEIHNSTLALFQRFDDLRATLSSRLPADMTGTTATITLTPEQLRYVRPTMVQINDLVTAMRDRCRTDAREAWELTTTLHDELKSKVGLTMDIQPKAGMTPPK